MSAFRQTFYLKKFAVKGLSWLAPIMIKRRKPMTRVQIPDGAFKIQTENDIYVKDI